MKLSKEVSDRIAMLRPILIIGIVFVHVYGVPDAPSQLRWDTFDLFAGFFKDAVFRGTVPTMSIIAGFLLFKSGLDMAPRKLFSKKFSSLVVPFLAFNVYYLLFTLAMNLFFKSALPYPDIFYGPILPVLSKIFGLFGYPLNLPLYFLRDMIVTIAMVPILSHVIRNAPGIGLVALALFFGLDMDGPLILRPTSLLLFYVGAVAAVFKWDILSLDKYASHCLFVFVSLCLLMIILRIDDNTSFVIVAPFLLWPAASLIVETKVGKWAIKFSDYSFFIFVAHAPLLVASWWAYNRFFPWIPYPLYWTAMPIVIVLILKQVYDMAMGLAPSIFKSLIGSRSKKPKFVERRRVPRPIDAPVYSQEIRKIMAN